MSIKGLCWALCCVILGTTALKSETTDPLLTRIVYLNTDSLPRVFQLGQYDGEQFEQLKTVYETNLFTACKGDMETAYYCWLHLLKHMESHAQRKGFDITGVKMWLYVFWEKDGTIKHLAYYLKPNSRNVNYDDMSKFLLDFCKNYTFPVKFDRPYSNYNSAGFPVMVEKNTSTGSNNGN